MKIKTVVSENAKVSEIVSRCAPISASNVKKLIKEREVRVNGTRICTDICVISGDEVEVFIPQTFVHELPKVVYKDENILIADKPIYTEVEPALTAYFKNEYPYIQPLHRLDRNTTGLVVFALNEKTYLQLYKAFKDRTVEKHYQAVTTVAPKVGEHTAYLFKDQKKSVCYVVPSPKVGYKKIVTKICSVEHSGEFFCVDIELVTGRTHQIRAHLAFLGAPILGDGKYGNNQTNKKYGVNYQMLCAKRIIFHGLEGELCYLNEKVFQSERKVLTKTKQ